MYFITANGPEATWASSKLEMQYAYGIALTSAQLYILSVFVTVQELALVNGNETGAALPKNDDFKDVC